MIDFEPARQFWRDNCTRRVVLAPYPDADGLAGAAILWRALAGEKEIVCPAKGETIEEVGFTDRLVQARPEALLVLDQGSRSGALLPGIPTLTVDHHIPNGVPDGVYLSSYHPGELSPSASALCYRLLGEPEDALWLAVVGLAGDYGINAHFPELQQAASRYSWLDLQDTVALVNAARRSSRFDWQTAFAALVSATDPRQIAHNELPQVEQLKHDMEEVRHELQKVRKAHPYFADPWAVVPFASPCMIHGKVASSWIHRLQAHLVVAANFGYRPGYVHFSVRSAQQINLSAAVARGNSAGTSRRLDARAVRRHWRRHDAQRIQLAAHPHGLYPAAGGGNSPRRPAALKEKRKIYYFF